MKRAIETKQLEKFERYLKDEERSEATVGKYMHDVRCFEAYVKNDRLNRDAVLAYKAMLGERYAVTSANSMIAALNCFFRFCGWHELVVKQFKMQRIVYTTEEKELTRAEYFRLVDAANAKKNERLKLIIQTICATGIRVSELQHITVEAVRRGEASVSCKGKNRRIFIVPSLRKKLLKYVKERKIESGAIFVTRCGYPVSRNSIWKDMKSLCQMARVAPAKVFPHNLRHLFARTFYNIEKDIAKLADILGHASIDTTRIYIVTTGIEHKRKMENMRLIV